MPAIFAGSVQTHTTAINIQAAHPTAAARVRWQSQAILARSASCGSGSAVAAGAKVVQETFVMSSSRDLIYYRKTIIIKRIDVNRLSWTHDSAEVSRELQRPARGKPRHANAGRSGRHVSTGPRRRHWRAAYAQAGAAAVGNAP